MTHSTLFSILGAACFVCVGVCVFAPPGLSWTIGAVVGSFIGGWSLNLALREKARESQPRG